MTYFKSHIIQSRHFSWHRNYSLKFPISCTNCWIASDDLQTIQTKLKNYDQSFSIILLKKSLDFKNKFFKKEKKNLHVKLTTDQTMAKKMGEDIPGMWQD